MSGERVVQLDHETVDTGSEPHIVTKPKIDEALDVESLQRQQVVSSILLHSEVDKVLLAEHEFEPGVVDHPADLGQIEHLEVLSLPKSQNALHHLELHVVVLAGGRAPVLSTFRHEAIELACNVGHRSGYVREDVFHLCIRVYGNQIIQPCSFFLGEHLCDEFHPDGLHFFHDAGILHPGDFQHRRVRDHCGRGGSQYLSLWNACFRVILLMNDHDLT